VVFLYLEPKTKAANFFYDDDDDESGDEIEIGGGRAPRKDVPNSKATPVAA
jgi:hypothetical protein